MSAAHSTGRECTRQFCNCPNHRDVEVEGATPAEMLRKAANALERTADATARECSTTADAISIVQAHRLMRRCADQLRAEAFVLERSAAA